MIGIIIVTHGDFGKYIIESAELIAGKQSNIMSLGLKHGDSVEELKNTLKENIIKMDEGDGVLVFVDLFGGSPSNVTLMNMKEVRFKSITGLNMPMLLEAITSRNGCSIEELADRCADIGRSGIRELHKELNTSNL